MHCVESLASLGLKWRINCADIAQQFVVYTDRTLKFAMLLMRIGPPPVGIKQSSQAKWIQWKSGYLQKLLAAC